MHTRNLLPIRLDCPRCGSEVPTTEIPGFSSKDGEMILLMLRICLDCEFIFETRKRTDYETKKFEKRS